MKTILSFLCLTFPNKRSLFVELSHVCHRPPESRPNSAHAALGWQLQSPLEWKYRPPVCRSSDTATTLMIDMYPWVSCWPWYCLKFSYESFCPWRHLQQEFAATSELLRSSAVEWPNSVGWTWRHMFNVLRLKPV